MVGFHLERRDTNVASGVIRQYTSEAISQPAIRGSGVDIIVTCHNQVEFIEEAIASVTSQMDPQRDRIVVVDDASEDGSSEKILGIDAPLELIALPANQGVAHARNLGLTSTTSEFVLFLDGDDKLSPNFLSETLGVLSSNPLAGYAYPTIVQFGKSSARTEAIPWNSSQLYMQNFVTCTSLFRRSLLSEAAFRDDLESLEDWDFVLTLLDAGVVGAPAVAATCFYRKHPDGNSRYDIAARNRLELVILEARIRFSHDSCPRSYAWRRLSRDLLAHVIARSPIGLPRAGRASLSRAAR